ncbi:MAG: LysE family transporter [Akkermansiaceae bacterium]|nr:LysE family transporter [Akkermansiaceae bacterium]
MPLGDDGPGAGYWVAGISRGSKASVIVAFGCTLGIVPHMAASILGLSALLHASAVVFQIVKEAIEVLFAEGLIKVRARWMVALLVLFPDDGCFTCPPMSSTILRVRVCHVLGVGEPGMLLACRAQCPVSGSPCSEIE